MEAVDKANYEVVLRGARASLRTRGGEKIAYTRIVKSYIAMKNAETKERHEHCLAALLAWLQAAAEGDNYIDDVESC